MRIDCSKISNKGDLLILVSLVLIVAVVGFAMFLAVYVHSFVAGFISATCLLKWHEWIYKPVDRMLEQLWRESKQ